ncbi:MAG: type III-B CRISPR module RAMP protein Cmr1 [Desulfobacteraceae bacterium]|nr:MAG: type III-B CRISPR module RAMP protein Cmr1 [Desulfobacteraceae bacterium]
MKPLKITAKCRIVTPMLSSGSDQARFEIRATEVKAGLRFWWRAFQSLSQTGLFTAEASLFGSTASACPFELRVHHSGKIQTWEPGSAFSENQSGNPAWETGIAYAFFSITEPVKPNKPIRLKSENEDIRKPGRAVAKPGGRFEIRIHFVRLETPHRVGDLLCSLWLLENLGGIGGRSRRGAGCFEIESLTINDTSEKDALHVPQLSVFLKNGVPAFHPSADQKPEEFLNQGLELILTRWKTTRRTLPVTYTAFDKNTSRILVCRDLKNSGVGSAMEIMGTIGTYMKNYCHIFPYEEACQMHEALENNQELPDGFTLEKACRGLPIIYNFTRSIDNIYSGRLDKTYTATSVKCDSAGKPLLENGRFQAGNGRRASPLLISCHQKGDDPYAVVCLFPAPLLPEDEKIWLKSSTGKSDKILSPPSFRFIEGLIFEKARFKRRSGELKQNSPLIDAFNRKFAIAPLKEISPPPPPPPPPLRSNQIGSLENSLNRARSLKRGDSFIVDSLMDEIDRLFGEGKEDDSLRLVEALKERLVELGIWENHPRKFDIESYL